MHGWGVKAGEGQGRRSDFQVFLPQAGWHQLHMVVLGVYDVTSFEQHANSTSKAHSEHVSHAKTAGQA